MALPALGCENEGALLICYLHMSSEGQGVRIFAELLRELHARLGDLRIEKFPDTLRLRSEVGIHIVTEAVPHGEPSRRGKQRQPGGQRERIPHRQSPANGAPPHISGNRKQYPTPRTV